MEFWNATAHVAGEAARLAEQVESEGFDGRTFGDTQCIAADPFVGLTLAAAAAPRLKLGVGVTNPVTRHAAVTACSIATVQLASGGRAGGARYRPRRLLPFQSWACAPPACQSSRTT